MGLNILNERSDQPVVKLDAPWEEGASFSYAITALTDPDSECIRLYYLVRHKESSRSILCMGTSTDGIAWEKPELEDGTNTVMVPAGPECSWGTFLPKRIVYDEKEEREQARWKMLYWDCGGPEEQPGLYLAISPDGIVWTPLGAGPAISNANDAASFVQVNPAAGGGPLEASYLLYQQTWKHNPTLPADRDNLRGLHRRISVWASRRFVPHTFGDGWIGPVTIIEPDDHDPPDLQYYWLSAFHNGDGYMGLLNCHHTGSQVMDVRLLHSPDGWSWEYGNGREPLIPPGPPGRFDCGMVSALSPPVYFDGNTYLFYNGRATVHDHAPRYPELSLPDPSGGIGLCVFEGGQDS